MGFLKNRLKRIEEKIDFEKKEEIKFKVTHGNGPCPKTQEGREEIERANPGTIFIWPPLGYGDN